MAIATQIAYTNGENTWMYPENLDVPQKRIIAAIDGQFLERRHHIKPFNIRRKLASILPPMLEDSLLNTQYTRKTMFTANADNVQQFMSISIKESYLDTLQGRFSKKKVTPILAAAPLVSGLSFYAESKNSIVIATAPDGNICAVYCSSKGSVKDFRTFPSDGKKWRKEAAVTIRSWQKEPTGNLIYIEDGIYLPAIFSKQKTSLKKQEYSYALIGLWQLSQQNWSPELQVPLLDYTITKQAERFVHILNKYALGIWAITLSVFITLGIYSYVTENTKKSLGEKQQAIFNIALPNVPMIDAELQMKRKLNELQLASGKSLSGRNSTVSDQIVNLSKAITSFDMTVRFEQASFSAKKVSLRGRIESLSEVDRLQRLLEKVYSKFKFKLLSTDVTENGSVNFGLEGTK